MVTKTDEHGHNWSDEVTFKLRMPESSGQSYVEISLDEARHKVITSTGVCPQTGLVTIFVKEALKIIDIVS
jgi:hypothetical protein